jgi:hypothetical protein
VACHQPRGIVTCSDSRAKSSAEEDGCGGGDLRRDSRRGGGRSLAAEGTAMRSAAAVKRNTDTTMTYATLVANDTVVSDHCMAPAARVQRSDCCSDSARTECRLQLESRGAYPAASAAAAAGAHRRQPARCNRHHQLHQRGNLPATPKCEPSATEQTTAASSIWRAI